VLQARGLAVTVGQALQLDLLVVDETPADLLIDVPLDGLRFAPAEGRRVRCASRPNGLSGCASRTVGARCRGPGWL
ncbi:hypothetical protein ABZ485_35155, partial [Streptomyces albogriseolus]|uniref:hypothetical protein n=1 Tax=Streptomyces albogriseolus TaxID=1887 RepID=UPI00345FB0F1